MKMTKDIEMKVMEVHNLFWESYARRDIELRFSLCSEMLLLSEAVCMREL